MKNPLDNTPLFKDIATHEFRNVNSVKSLIQRFSFLIDKVLDADLVMAALYHAEILGLTSQERTELFSKIDHAFHMKRRRMENNR